MLLKVDIEDLETVLNALYQANEKELLMKFKTDAQNMIWAMSEGSEHLTKHIHQWSDDKNNLIMEEKIPQSFSDFSLNQAKKNFKLQEKREKLFQSFDEVKASAWLQESLRKAKKQPLNTEKQRSEALIAPILYEVQDNNDSEFQMFSGEYVNIDKNKGLKGEFDFVFSLNKSFELNTPLFTIVEAKNADINGNWGQVVAQMVGARELNRQDGNYEIETIFGCLTTGDLWHFLKLEDNLITMDERPFALYSELPRILGVFQEIIDFYKVTKLNT